MSGRQQGVQMLVRAECKSPSLYVHCHAHRVNLVLVNACNNSPYVAEALGLMEAIHCFVNVSTLRHDVYAALQRDAGVPILALPKQSDTRWVCKHKAVLVFKSRFDFIRDVLLHYFSASLKGKERVEATGLVSQLLTVQFVFTLCLLDMILPLLSSATTFLQRYKPFY